MRIKLHKAQSEPFKDLFINKTVRHSVVVASRGFGKSYLLGAAASNAIFELLELPKWVPNKNVYIIAPTYSQVTDIYYPLLEYQIGLGAYAIKSSRDTGVFWFDRDVTLKLVSFEAVERLRGTGAYFVGNDEPSSWTKGVGFKDAWQGIIEPLISTRWSPARAKRYGAVSPGRSLTIGTPKGYNFLYEMYHYPEVDPDWKSYHYDYTRSPLLDPNEIEKIKHRIDPIEFAREYKASFEESGVRVFYCFDRKTHVQPVEPPYPPTEEEMGESIHIPIDFNVGIQASSAWCIRGSQAHCFDSWKGHPDTETLADYIAERFKGHTIYVYPDPTGNARKSSAPVGQTDFSILRSRGLKVMARQKSPSIVDSVAAVNRRLKSAAGDIEVYVDPKARDVIESLEKTSWVDKNPDLAVIDKTEGIEHHSDGVRYFFEYRWPIRNSSSRVAQGDSF